MAKAAGERIPEGWALDAEGNPTTDPDAALKGSLVSMGGYKGWGFGLMAEVLAAAMTGSVLSRDVKPLKAPEQKGLELPDPLNPPPGCAFAGRCPRATEICRTNVPDLNEMGEDQLAACHHPLES